MSQQQVHFHFGISDAERITIFVPPESFAANRLGDTYPTQVFMTDMAAVLKIFMPEPKFIATQISLLDEIVSGEKEIWVSHLHPQFGYVLDQAKLDIQRAG